MLDRHRDAGHSRRLDATDVLYDVGREVQMVALMMRRHRFVAAQGVCECGRLPAKTLPVFGLRCEIAVEKWERAHDAMRRLLRYAAAARRPPRRAIGRAEVRRRRRWPA